MMLQGIVHDADRMDTILRQLVDAARVVGGHLELFPEQVDVGDLVRGVAEAQRRDPDHPPMEWIGEHRSGVRRPGAAQDHACSRSWSRWCGGARDGRDRGRRRAATASGSGSARRGAGGRARDRRRPRGCSRRGGRARERAARSGCSSRGASPRRRAAGRWGEVDDGRLGSTSSCRPVRTWRAPERRGSAVRASARAGRLGRLMDPEEMLRIARATSASAASRCSQARGVARRARCRAGRGAWAQRSPFSADPEGAGLARCPGGPQATSGTSRTRRATALQAALAAERETLRAPGRRRAARRRPARPVACPGGAPRLGSLHPLTIVEREIVDVFTSLGFRVAEGPEIEDDWHNFQALNIPPDHPARTMKDSLYVERARPPRAAAAHRDVGGADPHDAVAAAARLRRGAGPRVPPRDRRPDPLCRSSTRSRASPSTRASRSPT